MSDIRYTPNLEYEKDYSTEGSIKRSVREEVVDSTTPSNKPADKIIDLIGIIPNDLAEHILPPVKYVVDTINSLGDLEDRINTTISLNPIDIPKTEATVTVKETTLDLSNINSIDDYPLPVKIFPEFPAFDITVSSPSDKIAEMDKQYKKDMSDVLNNFISKLNSKISDYASKVLSALNESQSSDLLNSIGNPYSVNTSDIKDSNLKHLSDTIVRTQILRDQKIRMTKKMFNLSGTTVHIKSCKVSSELRKRYYSEKNIEADSVLDIVQNSNLSALKAGYDKKYKENFYNLYKYMNGTVIMIDECLRLYVQEAQAKAILSKKEGIKL